MTNQCPTCNDPLENIPKLKLIADISPEVNIYHCPACSTYYYYRISTSGASNNSLEEEAEEYIGAISKEEADRLTAPKPVEVELSSSTQNGKCSNCGSKNTELLEVMNVEVELFYNIKCHDCGEESTLDDWQWTYGL